MSTEVAGRVNIVLGMNAVTFTEGIKKAQADLDKFAGKSKAAGHATVNSTQAASAALRVMQGDMTNNIRAVERFVGAIPGVGAALKVAFPLVGGIAFASLIVDMGMKVRAFIKTVDEMPNTITKGFQSLTLSQKTANDELDVTNDKLQNSIDKLEKKPTDGLKLGMDEAKTSADHLAESISGASDKLNELLSKNHINGMQALWGMWGTVSTAGVEGTAKYFNQKLSADSSNFADDPSEKNHGVMIGDVTAALREATASLKRETDKRDAPISTAEKFAGAAVGLSGAGAISLRPNNSDLIADLQGEVNYYKGLLRTDKSTTTNQALTKQQTADQAKKEAADLAKQQTEAAKTAATARVEAMQNGLNAMKLQYNLSIKATYDFWELKKSTELAGGTAYNDIVKKQADLAAEGAAKAHSVIAKYQADALRSRSDDATTGPALINQSAKFMQGQAVKTSDAKDEQARNSNQQLITGSDNATRLREAQITDASGKSMTRYAAALSLAAVHAAQLKDTLLALSGNVDIAQKNYDDAVKNGDQSQIAKAGSALDAAKNANSNANITGQIQKIHDQNAIDPGFTSATVGAKDALNDFVIQSRDAAGMMKELVTNTLTGLNQQIANAIQGKKTSFGQVAKTAGNTMINDGLKKMEGSAISHFSGGKFGGGKLGSKGNPMFVNVVNGGSKGGKDAMSALGGNSKSDGSYGKSSSSSGIMGFFNKIFGGGSSGGSDSSSVSGGGDDMDGPDGGGDSISFPAFANGGYMDGPSLIGEHGPEILDAKGYVTPNHKLSMMGGSQQNVTYSIDARGSDPVATDQRVRRSIVAAHQSAVVQSVKQVQQQKIRTPQRGR